MICYIVINNTFIIIVELLAMILYIVDKVKWVILVYKLIFGVIFLIKLKCL